MFIVWMIGILAGLLSFRLHGFLKKVLGFITIIMIVLFMSCNNISPDELNMENRFYTDSSIFASSLFYDLLSAAANKLHLSFGEFNVVLIFSALFLIRKMIMNYTTNYGFIFSLFLASGAILDSTLFRQFIASSIILFSFQYLIGERKNLLKYLFFVVIAIGFHAAMAVFLLFGLLAIHRKTRKHFMLHFIVYAASFFLILGTLFNNNILPGLTLLSKIFENNIKINLYISMATKNKAWLLVLFLWIIMAIICKFSKSMAVKYNLDNKTIICLNDISLIITLSLGLLPFSLMHALIFSRLYRPLIWLILISITLILEKVPLRKINIPLHALLIFITSYYFLMYNRILYSWEYCTIYVFRGSFFWNNIK